MIRLLVAIILGAVVATGGVFAVHSALDSAAKGNQQQGPLKVYAYGQR
jgi:hypothetical protein